MMIRIKNFVVKFTNSITTFVLKRVTKRISPEIESLYFGIQHLDSDYY